MDKHLVSLEIARLQEICSRSRSNKYSSKGKKEYFESLYKTVSELSKQDILTASEDELKDIKLVYDFLYGGLQFLDSSTLNVSPFEMVYCLTKALEDWVDSSDLLIVTSLSHRISEFYLEGLSKESLSGIKKVIKNRYNVHFNSRLIRIALPKFLSRDYLSGVVLYHELGHFVDLELRITDKLFFEKFRKLPQMATSNEELMFYYHGLEFFADLFAAQYVNDACALFLQHTAGSHGDSRTHPSTSKRIHEVRQFLNGTPTSTSTRIQEALKASGHPPLQKRHELINPSKTDFQDLIPQQVDSNSHLHGLYKLGWDLWLDSDSNFLKDFSLRQRYYIVNNLIEKSISNYNVLATWNSQIHSTSNVD